MKPLILPSQKNIIVKRGENEKGYNFIGSMGLHQRHLSFLGMKETHKLFYVSKQELMLLLMILGWY